ncbi:hypothetical protein, partial [Enterobacter hormaechei]
FRHYVLSWHFCWVGFFFYFNFFALVWRAKWVIFLDIFICGVALSLTVLQNPRWLGGLWRPPTRQFERFCVKKLTALCGEIRKQPVHIRLVIQHVVKLIHV